jgi:hypothetical protein
VVRINYYRHYKPDFILINDSPDSFLASADSVHFQSFNVVENPQSAAIIAEAYIRAIYNDSFSDPYTVYFDEDNQLYYVSSHISWFRTEVDIIISRATGEIIGIAKGKF